MKNDSELWLKIPLILSCDLTRNIEIQLPSGIWTNWIFSPEFSDTEKVTTVIASARDVTANKQAAKALETSESDIGRFLKLPVMVFCYFNRQGIYDCNEQAVKFFECNDKGILIVPVSAQRLMRE